MAAAACRRSREASVPPSWTTSRRSSRLGAEPERPRPRGSRIYVPYADLLSLGGSPVARVLASELPEIDVVVLEDSYTAGAMAEVRIRPMNELDIEGICRIDERITGRYRPDVWEQRVAYYIRRDPDSSQVAESDGRVVGFMLGEVRGGEFGLDEPTGWVEFFGVDPSAREKGIGRRLIEALLGHFRARGAHVARTMVAAQDKDIAAFIAAMGFAPAPVTALEKRL